MTENAFNKWFDEKMKSRRFRWLYRWYRIVGCQNWGMRTQRRAWDEWVGLISILAIWAVLVFLTAYSVGIVLNGLMAGLLK